jgi:hypothetical protein
VIAGIARNRRNRKGKAAATAFTVLYAEDAERSLGTDRDSLGIKPGYPSGRGRDTLGTNGDERGRTGGWQGEANRRNRRKHA